MRGGELSVMVCLNFDDVKFNGKSQLDNWQ